MTQGIGEFPKCCGMKESVIFVTLQTKKVGDENTILEFLVYAQYGHWTVPKMLWDEIICHFCDTTN